MSYQYYIALISILMVIYLPEVNADEDQYVIFEDEHLRYGRVVWMGTCENCHGYGVGDAPIPMRPADWKDRVSKPRELLHEHAINGFFGIDDAYMPERGGNVALSDDDVKAAVNYMLELANFYIAKEH